MDGNKAQHPGAEQAEDGVSHDSSGDPGRGNSLQDASDEAVREIEKSRDGAGHAGTGDFG